MEAILYENTFNPVVLAGPSQHKLYIIRNGWVYGEWKNVQANFKSITSRAIRTFIEAKGANDFFCLYVYVQRDGLDYKLAYTPPGF